MDVRMGKNFLLISEEKEPAADWYYFMREGYLRATPLRRVLTITENGILRVVIKSYVVNATIL